jgi:hypothetical protein
MINHLTLSQVIELANVERPLVTSEGRVLVPVMKQGLSALRCNSGATGAIEGVARHQFLDRTTNGRNDSPASTPKPAESRIEMTENEKIMLMG